MYDDVYYDEFSGKIVNIVAPDQNEKDDQDVDEADKFLSQFEEE